MDACGVVGRVGMWSGLLWSHVERFVVEIYA